MKQLIIMMLFFAAISFAQEKDSTKITSYSVSDFTLKQEIKKAEISIKKYTEDIKALDERIKFLQEEKKKSKEQLLMSIGKYQGLKSLLLNNSQSKNLKAKNEK